MRRSRPVRTKKVQKRFKVLLVILVSGLIWIGYGARTQDVVNNPSESPKAVNPLLVEPEPTKPTPFSETFSGSLFVPYWLVSSDVSLPTELDAELEKLMYFGITPGTSGINTTEPGYSNLDAFIASTEDFSGEKLLTIRMTQEENTSDVLNSTPSQDKIIKDSIFLAQKHGFDGLVLDLEHSVLPTKKTINAITDFTTRISKETQAQNLTFSITLYGDTYYRLRPYDVPALGKVVDHIYIMTYDFHKSFGEPGPNFPLTKGDTYGYSLESMIADFSQDVSQDKITVVLGMFGYDWSVDDQDRPAKAAAALTANQAQARFYPTCTKTDCVITRDPVSSERSIRYTDESGQKHVVWSEDTQSLQKKADYIRSQGISHISLWAHGYY